MPSRAITISPSTAEWAQLGEVAKERPLLARPKRELAAVVLEDPAEPVPLRLVLPAVALRQLLDELGLHRREGDVGARHARRLEHRPFGLVILDRKSYNLLVRIRKEERDRPAT
jgi:hypothetical protein